MEEEKKHVEATAGEQTEQKKVSTFRKVMKITGYVLAALVILLLIAIWQLDRIVATTVPAVGSSLVGTAVELDAVAISILRGDVEISGFRVGNPEGFHKEYAFEVKKFHVDVDVSSITGDEIVVECIEISGLNLDFEYNILRGINLQVILDNVNAAAKKSEAPADDNAAESEAEEETADAAQKKVVIRKLVLNDISMTISSGVTQTSVPIILPPIEMENIGEGKNLAETIAEIFNEVFAEIIKAVDLKKLGGSLDELSESVLDGVDSTAGETVRNVVDGASEFIKNLPGRGR